MTAVALKPFSWERMIAAVEDVRERACRAAGALQRAGIPYLLDVGLIDPTWSDRLP